MHYKTAAAIKKIANRIAEDFLRKVAEDKANESFSTGAYLRALSDVPFNGWRPDTGNAWFTGPRSFILSNSEGEDVGFPRNIEELARRQAEYNSYMAGRTSKSPKHTPEERREVIESLEALGRNKRKAFSIGINPKYLPDSFYIKHMPKFLKDKYKNDRLDKDSVLNWLDAGKLQAKNHQANTNKAIG